MISLGLYTFGRETIEVKCYSYQIRPKVHIINMAGDDNLDHLAVPDVFLF
jgi:hypothetical protein